MLGVALGRPAITYGRPDIMAQIDDSGRRRCGTTTHFILPP